MSTPSRAALAAYTHDRCAGCSAILLHGDLKHAGKTWCSACYLRALAAEVSPGHVGNTPRVTAGTTPVPAPAVETLSASVERAVARVLSSIEEGWQRADGKVCVIPNAAIAELKVAHTRLCGAQVKESANV